MKVKKYTLTDLLNRIIAKDTPTLTIVKMAQNIHDQIWNEELIIVDVDEAINDEIKSEGDVYSYFDMYIQILMDAYNGE